jgi:hypothetical protein
MVLTQRPLDLCEIIHETSAPLPQRARVMRPDVRDRLDYQTAGRRVFQRFHQERHGGERPTWKYYFVCKCAAGFFSGQNGAEMLASEKRKTERRLTLGRMVDGGSTSTRKKKRRGIVKASSPISV